MAIRVDGLNPTATKWIGVKGVSGTLGARAEGRKRNREHGGRKQWRAGQRVLRLQVAPRARGRVQMHMHAVSCGEASQVVAYLIDRRQQSEGRHAARV
jgi:hypothetical protein